MNSLDDTRIAVCHTHPEEDDAFQRASEENEPHLCVSEDGDYARVECDMVTVTWRALTDTAVATIYDIMEEYVTRAYDNSDHQETPIYYGGGNQYLTVNRLLVEDARDLARELEPIVFDEDNWEPRAEPMNDLAAQ